MNQAQQVRAEEMYLRFQYPISKTVSQAAAKQELNIQVKNNLKDLEKQLGFHMWVS